MRRANTDVMQMQRRMLDGQSSAARPTRAEALTRRRSRRDARLALVGNLATALSLAVHLGGAGHARAAARVDGCGARPYVITTQTRGRTAWRGNAQGARHGQHRPDCALGCDPGRARDRVQVVSVVVVIPCIPRLRSRLHVDFCPALSTMCPLFSELERIATPFGTGSKPPLPRHPSQPASPHAVTRACADPAGHAESRGKSDQFGSRHLAALMVDLLFLSPATHLPCIPLALLDPPPASSTPLIDGRRRKCRRKGSSQFPNRGPLKCSSFDCRNASRLRRVPLRVRHGKHQRY